MGEIEEAEAVAEEGADQGALAQHETARGALGDQGALPPRSPGAPPPRGPEAGLAVPPSKQRGQSLPTLLSSLFHSFLFVAPPFETTLLKQSSREPQDRGVFRQEVEQHVCGCPIQTATKILSSVSPLPPPPLSPPPSPLPSPPPPPPPPPSLSPPPPSQSSLRDPRSSLRALPGQREVSLLLLYSPLFPSPSSPPLPLPCLQLHQIPSQGQEPSRIPMRYETSDQKYILLCKQ